MPRVAFPDLLDPHAQAGARYAAAAAELRDSLVELAAVEHLLPPSGDQTFEAWQPDALPELRHRIFLARPPQGIRAGVLARVAELQAEPG